MPSYKLTYFDARARGEISRMLFAAADKAFVDQRVQFEDWPKLKGDMPQATMPVLEIDGKRKISQSTAIARYLAREFNLYGKGMDCAMCDQIFDTALDVFGSFVPVAFLKDEAEKAEKMKDFYETTAPKFLGFLEALVKEGGGKGGFAVGSSVTLADLALYVYLENMGLADKLEKFPLLAANRKTTAALPKIKKYLASRKETSF